MRLSADRPVMLVAEDLHWADLASLDLLNFLVRNLTGHGVVIVGSWRSEVGRDHPIHLWSTELAAPTTRSNGSCSSASAGW